MEVYTKEIKYFNYSDISKLYLKLDREKPYFTVREGKSYKNMDLEETI